MSDACPPAALERSAREVGHHRSVKLPDLLVAAIGETDGLTVLHYDADFDRVSDITGQPTEWVVEQGTIS